MSRSIRRSKGNGDFLTLPSYRAGLELKLWNPQAEKSPLAQSHPIYLQVTMCPCHLSKNKNKKEIKLYFTELCKHQLRCSENGNSYPTEL